MGVTLKVHLEEYKVILNCMCSEKRKERVLGWVRSVF